jgi:hypothetical protein
VIEIFGLGPENLKQLQYAIGFTRRVNARFQPEVYKALYENIKLHNLTIESEMLLLQRNLRQEQDPGALLADVKNQIDEDCRLIIRRIVKEVETNDNSISTYIVDSIECALLNANMKNIIEGFYDGTIERILLLFQYSTRLPIQTKCFLIDALLKVFEKQQSLESLQAMYLWAYAKNVLEEEQSWSQVAASDQNLCTDAIDKLSSNKHKFFQNFQKFILFPDKHKICDMHSIPWESTSIVRDFVSFYYNGDVERTKNLLTAAIENKLSYTAGRILRQLYEELKISTQLKSFEAFRLFNAVKISMSCSNFNSQTDNMRLPYEQLKEMAPEWVRQLLWQDNISQFQILSKRKIGLQLFAVEKDKYQLKWKPAEETHAEGGWWVKVDPETSLVTFSLPCGLNLGLEKGKANLGYSKYQFMIRGAADDDLHFQMFSLEGVS